MADLLVRGLEPSIVSRLKEAAKQHGRSLQGEVKAILTDAAPFTKKQALAVTRAWRKRLAGRKFSDSVDLIREDRER
jgi:antitoxin FitA